MKQIWEHRGVSGPFKDARKLVNFFKGRSGRPWVKERERFVKSVIEFYKQEKMNVVVVQVHPGSYGHTYDVK